MQDFLPAEAMREARAIGRADIVIGIPSYNNARTIAHVVRAAHAGLAKYFPQYTSAIVNSDGGSTDGTRQAVLSASLEDANLLLFSHPLMPVSRISMPYHGIPGKGSAFRLIFGLAERLGARACAVVTDDYPTFFLPRMVEAAAASLPVRLEAVDASGVVPFRLPGSDFPTAFAFRRWLQRELPRWLPRRPAAAPLSRARLPPPPALPREVSRRWPARDWELIGPPSEYALTKMPLTKECTRGKWQLS
jgi:glycosyltransferase involved in cell wall biosynthesis